MRYGELVTRRGATTMGKTRAACKWDQHPNPTDNNEITKICSRRERALQGETSMHKSNTKARAIIVAEMVTLHEERGPQTNDDLIRAGYSQEQVETCAPLAAQEIARRQRMAA